MSTPKQVRYSLLGKKMIKNLEKRGFEAYYFDTSEEAVENILKLIPEGSSVSWGGSATIRDIGLTEKIKSGNYEAYDRDPLSPEEKEELYRKVFTMDCYLTSTNAITEDGLLINVDGNSNRISALAFGPKNVIVVTGMNKVTPTEESAMVRARSYASPINAARFSGKTPCAVEGACKNCLSEDCICNQILITRRSKPINRIKIILIGEDLGF